MAQQVKFYSTATLPASPNAGGVYFVDGGELYKGSQRFGLGRVTVAESTTGITGMARGDVVVTGNGAGWVYVGSGEGEGWKSIGGDIGSLQSSWRADIQTWISGLVQSSEGSYITGITQDPDGKVTAAASNFATDVKNAVGDGSASSTANGITVSVTTTSGKVTDVQVSASQITCNTVTASAATFTDLTVTSTATFSATEVSAGTLTVGGVSVNNVAAASATGSNNGVAVTVSTLGGGVDAVGVAVTGNLATFAGKSVVTAVGPATGDNAASDDNIATEKAVRDAIATLTNVMHFKGVVKATPATGEAGDIVVIGGLTPQEEEAGDLKNGQEYIYDGTKWEKIGDQSAVTGGSDSDAKNGITVSVATTAGTAAPDVTLTVAAVSTAADVSAQGTADNVVTAGAVNGFVTGITNNKASVGTGNATGGYGISGQVILASNAQPELTITVDAIAASTGIATGVDKVVTAGAVADYVTGVVDGLDAGVSSSDNAGIQVGVTQAHGKVTAVTADIVWLGADGQPVA